MECDVECRCGISIAMDHAKVVVSLCQKPGFDGTARAAWLNRLGPRVEFRGNTASCPEGGPAGKAIPPAARRGYLHLQYDPATICGGLSREAFGNHASPGNGSPPKPLPPRYGNRGRKGGLPRSRAVVERLPTRTWKGILR